MLGEGRPDRLQVLSLKRRPLDRRAGELRQPDLSPLSASASVPERASIHRHAC
jgi:hypothetical protein